MNLPAPSLISIGDDRRSRVSLLDHIDIHIKIATALWKGTLLLKRDTVIDRKDFSKVFEKIYARRDEYDTTRKASELLAT